MWWADGKFIWYLLIASPEVIAFLLFGIGVAILGLYFIYKVIRYIYRDITK